MNYRKILRKLLAVATLSALLVGNVPALADSLFASDLPVCCNTMYCPLHRGQSRNAGNDKNNCDAQGNPLPISSSMRACDSVPAPVVGTAPFVLVSPIIMLYPATTERVQIRASRFAPSNVSLPSTPPPRTLPS